MAMLRGDESAQGGVYGLIALILTIAGIVFLVIGGASAGHCWATVLYWFAAAALVFGIDGSLVFKTKWFVIGGTAGCLVLVVVAVGLGMFAQAC